MVLTLYTNDRTGDICLQNKADYRGTVFMYSEPKAFINETVWLRTDYLFGCSEKKEALAPWQLPTIVLHAVFTPVSPNGTEHTWGRADPNITNSRVMAIFCF